uniref:LYR motif-containing protein 1 n=1 Tax=Acartia pacifica TaxID=335913 RepID=A0A0U2V7Y9_ACAPC|nr:LYR motif-containing protein 1 [Acartia pacifica]
MAVNSTRSQALSLYARLLRLARNWQATNPTEVMVERNYIRDETRELFRKNAKLTNPTDIKLCLREAEARVTMAEHYRNPYPRPVNLPRRSYSKQEGKKIGKAIQKMNDMSRPVYIRSTDDTVNRSN